MKEICASAATLIAAGRSVRCAAAEMASGKMALVPTPRSAKPSERQQRAPARRTRAPRRRPSRQSSDARHAGSANAGRRSRRRRSASSPARRRRARPRSPPGTARRRRRRACRSPTSPCWRPPSASPRASPPTSTRIGRGRPGEPRRRLLALRRRAAAPAGSAPSNSATATTDDRHHQRQVQPAARPRAARSPAPHQAGGEEADAPEGMRAVHDPPPDQRLGAVGLDVEDDLDAADHQPDRQQQQEEASADPARAPRSRRPAAINGIAASSARRKPTRSSSGVAKVSAISVPTGVPISPSPSAPSSHAHGAPGCRAAAGRCCRGRRNRWRSRHRPGCAAPTASRCSLEVASRLAHRESERAVQLCRQIARRGETRQRRRVPTLPRLSRRRKPPRRRRLRAAEAPHVVTEEGRARLFRRARHLDHPEVAADRVRLRGGHLHRRPRPGRGAGAGAQEGRAARRQAREHLHRGPARGVRARLRLPDVPRQRPLRGPLPARHLDRPPADRQAPGRDRRARPAPTPSPTAPPARATTRSASSSPPTRSTPRSGSSPPGASGT